jgi:predicted TIM-barrel fold metal-dependent hydrolase
MSTPAKAALAIAALLPLARWAFFRGPMATPVSAPPKGLLDMHCHTAGMGHCGSGAWVSEDLRNSWKFPLYLKIFETSVTELKTHGDRIVLDKIARRLEESEYVSDAVILAMDEPFTSEGMADASLGELHVSNRWLGQTLKDYPRLHFGASVHPARKDAIEELRWSKEHDAVFVKWLPNIQNIDPSHEGYTDYYRALVELDLPLLTHVGAEDSFSRANDRLGDPRHLKLPLDCGVKVIAAHVASSGQTDDCDNIDHLLEMMPKYPNLVADISTLTQMNRTKYLPKVLNDPRLRGRLMWGTDHPLTNTPLVTPLQYPLRLTLSQLWDISRTRNPWDRAVKLKAALGVPPEVFTRGREFLRI